jgi:L-fucose isomerase-like protein
MTAIYTLTSALHDEKAVSAVTREFLESIGLEYELKGSDYSDYGTDTLSLIYVRTGGTEGIFKRLLPELQAKSKQPFYLLTSGKSNSLAASMEILSYLRQHDIRGEIIHGSTTYIAQRIQLLEMIGRARKKLQGARLGIIGEPSDWLISSHADKKTVLEHLGIELVDIPMQKLLDTIGKKSDEAVQAASDIETIQQAIPGALGIYEALKAMVDAYQLQGFTLRCFDLLTAVKNTGCLALAKLNSEGYVAGCEGDVPAMLSMMIVRALLGVSGFQANPSNINPETGEMLFAHCTIPFDMVEEYELDTHFESGIGVGIRGFMKEGAVTIFKLSGDLSRYFVAEGTLVRNQAKPDLCRTQQVIELSDKSQTAYFMKNPIGNHHIIMPGYQRDLINGLLDSLGL